MATLSPPANTSAFSLQPRRHQKEEEEKERYGVYQILFAALRVGTETALIISSYTIAPRVIM